MENKKLDKHAKVECHKKAAEFYQTAAKHHLEAAKHCEADDCGKAAIETLKAFAFARIGKKQFKKIAMHCAEIQCCDCGQANCHCCGHKK